jgi:hypothetical protein
MTDRDNLDDVDFDALRRAMDLAMRNPNRAEQLKAKLKTASWREVAEFAAYCCQIETLHLRPWEEAPCHAVIVEPDGRGRMREMRDPKAGALMDRLLAAGLSQWEPDPLGALAKVKKERRK